MATGLSPRASVRVPLCVCRHQMRRPERNIQGEFFVGSVKKKLAFFFQSLHVSIWRRGDVCTRLWRGQWRCELESDSASCWPSKQGGHVLVSQPLTGEASELNALISVLIARLALAWTLLSSSSRSPSPTQPPTLATLTTPFILLIRRKQKKSWLNEIYQALIESCDSWGHAKLPLSAVVKNRFWGQIHADRWCSCIF